MTCSIRTCFVTDPHLDTLELVGYARKSLRECAQSTCAIISRLSPCRFQVESMLSCACHLSVGTLHQLGPRLRALRVRVMHLSIASEQVVGISRAQQKRRFDILYRWLWAETGPRYERPTWALIRICKGQAVLRPVLRTQVLIDCDGVSRHSRGPMKAIRLGCCCAGMEVRSSRRGFTLGSEAMGACVGGVK